MTKYTVSIDFVVEAKDKFQAENLAETIKNIVAAHAEDDGLYMGLSDSELTGIYQDEEEAFDQYAAWDEQSARERREIYVADNPLVVSVEGMKQTFSASVHEDYNA